nr:SpvB/TcaC N-terminal domain-containing protein [Streptomyces coryli]
MTPGRSGFGPSLALVTRKTDKGMPTYDDAHESDVFVLSSAEDLVPVLGGDDLPERRNRMVDGTAYLVTCYRPRIEGLFARIERWARDNITTVYGKDRESRIADPTDPDAIVYRYATDDDRTAAHERDRPDAGRTAQRYPRSVRYGNKVSRPADPPPERDPADGLPWSCRNDPFSAYRAGFEVRSYRLCQRILMFHHSAEEPGAGTDCLVCSLALTCRGGRAVNGSLRPGDPSGAVLESVTTTGHRRDGVGGYASESMPVLELIYSPAQFGDEGHEMDAASVANLPFGLDAPPCQLVDLDAESIAGVLSEQSGAWSFGRNLGEGRLGARAHVPLASRAGLGHTLTKEVGYAKF